MTCESDGQGGNLSHGIAAVVAVFAETLWEQGLPERR